MSSPSGGEQGRVQAGQALAQRGQTAEKTAEPRQIAGVGDPEGGAAREALEVADPAKLLPRGRAPGGLGDESGHRVLTSRDGVEIEQRAKKPLPEHPCSHRRRRPVEGGQERAARAPVVGALEELESGHGRRVEHEGVSRSETLEPREVTEGVSLGLLEIGESGPRRLDTRAHVADAQAVQRRHTEVRGQSLARRAQREPGGLAARDGKSESGEARGQRGLGLAREEALRRLPQEGGFEQAPALPARLADPELARGHVDEGGPQGAPRARSGAMQGEEEVVRGPVQVLRVGERPRGDDAHHLSPHELLALARRLHLLAHRHLAPGANQPGDIAVGRVMGNARHGDGALPLLARGEGDLEQARALVGVLEEELVEVAEAEEEEVVGVALLELPVLQHHWRQRGRQRGDGNAGDGGQETAGTARRPMTRRDQGKLGRVAGHGPRAARRRSYVVSRDSGSTLVSATTDMKLLSPPQRGTTCMWR